MDLSVVVHHQKKVMMECDIKRASVLFLTDFICNETHFIFTLINKVEIAPSK